MALCIRHTDNKENKVCSEEWCIGESLPNIEIMKIDEIYADGHELELVLDFFNGLIPRPKKYYVIWEGALAKIIAERLYQIKIKGIL
jgi:hypothetical protein